LVDDLLLARSQVTRLPPRIYGAGGMLRLPV
jgi:hypothetical protein